MYVEYCQNFLSNYLFFSLQTGPVLNFPQTHSQIAAELAISQLPPHPASEPLRSTRKPPHPASTPPTNPTMPHPKTNHQTPQQSTNSIKSAASRTSPLSQTLSSATFDRRSAYHSYMIENSLPEIEEGGLDLPPGVTDTSNPLPLPPHKVLETTGSLPYQADVVHHSAYSQNSNGNKKLSMRFSNFSWIRKSGYSYSSDDTWTSSVWSQRSSGVDDPGQDLVFANRSVKESDFNGNGMTDIDLTEGVESRSDGKKKEVGTSGRIEEGKDRGMRKEVNSNCILGTTQ